jgi:hypothetical protein
MQSDVLRKDFKSANSRRISYKKLIKGILISIRIWMLIAQEWTYCVLLV